MASGANGSSVDLYSMDDLIEDLVDLVAIAKTYSPRLKAPFFISELRDIAGALEVSMAKGVVR